MLNRSVFLWRACANVVLLFILAFYYPAHGLSTSPVPITSDTFVQLAKKVNPHVVNISTLTAIKQSRLRGTPDDMIRRMFEDFWRRGGGGLPFSGEDFESDERDSDAPLPGRPKKGGPKGPQAMSLGTGFVVDSEGLILTNHHVIAEADEIKISFTESPTEKPLDGKVVGRDPELDIALIQVKTKQPLVPLPLGNSDLLEVGEWVMAVGNPFGQGHTVVNGLASGLGRQAPDFPLASYIQTTAPINPGNSGGPLVNLAGEVIGINNAIDPRGQGIGFAIPINLVKRILPQLKSRGSVARGYIGVQVGELTPELAANIKVSKDLKAPFVTNVFADGPAAAVGVKTYDVILEFNGKPIASASELIGAVTAVEVGETVPMKLLRENKTLTVQIKVAQRPGNGDSAHFESKSKSTPKAKKAEEKTGLTLENRAQEVWVIRVAEGSPGETAGIQPGDVLLEVDRKPVKDQESFQKWIASPKSYLIRVRRKDPQGRDVFAVVLLDLKS